MGGFGWANGFELTLPQLFESEIDKREQRVCMFRCLGAKLSFEDQIGGF